DLGMSVLSPAQEESTTAAGNVDAGVRVRGTMPATVLVGFAEALAAPETVWSLVDGGFKVVAFARRGKSSGLSSSRHVVCHDICPPETDLQQSLAELRALTDSVGAEDGVQPILLPLDDKAVWLGNQVSLEKNWILAGPRGATAELALNKAVQTRMAIEAGFNVPKTSFARTASEVFAFADE